jgi:hypothetical protein
MLFGTKLVGINGIVATYEIHQSTILKRVAVAAGYQQVRCKLRTSDWRFVPASVSIPNLALDLAASASGFNQPPSISYEAWNIPSYTIMT